MIAGTLARLLVATDGSPNANRAVSFAIAVARKHGSELVFCSVVDRGAAIAACSDSIGGGEFLLPMVDQLDDAAKSIVSEAETRARGAGVDATSIVLDGPIAPTIVLCANGRDADAIVIGAQGQRGLERFFFGSTADGVLRRTDIPVFVVPPGSAAAEPTFGRIMVAVDDSDPSDAAVAFALDIAESDTARLLFCAVVESRETIEKGRAFGYDPEPMVQDLRTRAAALLATHGEEARKKNVAFKFVIAQGDPADEIVKTATEQRRGLIVIGTHGRRGLRRLLVGSVAEAVARRSMVPVVVVRTDRSRVRKHESACRREAVAANGAR